VDIEEELRSRMRTVNEVEADLGVLRTRGVAHGKRLIRRRRVIQTIAGGATLAIAIGVFAYAEDPRRSPEAGIAAPAPTVRQTDITPQAALKILLELLPPGSRTGSYEGGDSTNKRDVKSPAVWAHATYTDAIGTSNLMLSVGRFPRASCSRNLDEHCTQTRLTDGSLLTLIRITNHQDPRQKVFYVVLDRRDGLHITLNADNSEQDKGTATRPAPPLSMEQLRAIVTNPRWNLRVDESFAREAAPLFTPVPARPPVSIPPVTSPSPS
jgi:hypothetical protein